MDKGVDWTTYLKTVLALLRAAKKQIYVKSGIRALVKGIEYFPEETDPDFYAVKA